MFVEEARWIRHVLERAGLPAGASVLDVGSSTRAFREEVQPHIDQEIFAPLRSRGLVVSHLDAKPQDGVDIVCDVTGGVDVAEVLGRRFDLVLCCSMLEHVTDRPRTARAVSELVVEGGRLVVTVPRRYRYHEDPIDTSYRPRPDELAHLVQCASPGLDIVESTVVEVRDKRFYRAPLGSGRPLRTGTRLRRLLPGLRWQQSCLLMRRVAR